MAIDECILSYLNQWARHSWALDSLVVALSVNGLLKGGVLCGLLWWGWFARHDQQLRRREHIVATLGGCVAAMLAARALTMTLPFRARPMHEAGLAFTLPLGMKPTLLETWSSFPSDHAALFFALAAGLFYVSRRAGLFAVVYAFLFVALPRLYLGLHYPTDILGGAVLGVSLVCLSNAFIVSSPLTRAVANWAHNYPGYFCPLFFLLTYQIADMFNSSRALAGALVRVFLGDGA